MSVRSKNVGRNVSADQYLDENGLLYLWQKMKEVFASKNETITDVDWDAIKNKPDLVLKTVYDAFVTSITNRVDSAESDISTRPTIDQMNTAISNAVSSVYRYVGSVASYSNLPTENLSNGGVYNVRDTDMNYAWVASDEGGYWDPLGSTFSIEPIPNEVIQSIVDGTYAENRNLASFWV